MPDRRPVDESQAAQPNTDPAGDDPIRTAPGRSIVLVVDRLGAGQLSHYGNTCFETENISRLAAESLVFETAISPSADLLTAYKAIWPGQGWLTQLNQQGIPTTLVTDDLTLADHPLVDQFSEVLSMQVKPATQPADSPAETELAQFFAQATEWLLANQRAEGSASQGSMIWLHCRGLSSAWDAPYELRKSMADEEDPAPIESFETPHLRLDPNADPDQLLGYQQACMAQIRMLDDFIGVLLDLLDRPEFADTLFCLLSTRGFPLGEHGLVGAGDTSVLDRNDQPESASDAGGLEGHCFAEASHVPLLFRFPAREGLKPTAMVRCQSIVQPEQAIRLVENFVKGDFESLHQQLEPWLYSLPKVQRELAVSRFGAEASIQTHAWKLVSDLADQHQLFAKPDDRWEVNDVSRRCPQIVEQLLELLRGRLATTSAPSSPPTIGQTSTTVELPEALVYRE